MTSFYCSKIIQVQEWVEHELYLEYKYEIGYYFIFMKHYYDK